MKLTIWSFTELFQIHLTMPGITMTALWPVFGSWLQAAMQHHVSVNQERAVLWTKFDISKVLSRSQMSSPMIISYPDCLHQPTGYLLSVPKQVAN